MKITESVYSAGIPFRIPAGGGRYHERWVNGGLPVRTGHSISIDRSVNAFLVSGQAACLVDAGVAGSAPSLLAMAGEAGRAPGGVSTLVLTHSHPDHLGGALAVRRATGCIIAAHPAERAWIEDTKLQERERPVPGFSSLVEGPVRIDRLLGDGDRITIGGDRSLAVIHTPGHSPGSISLFLEDEGVVIAGDAIPVTGGIPVYDDPVASLRSIARLEQLHGVKVLLSSWDSPKRGAEVRGSLDEGAEVIRTLHGAVVRAAETGTDPKEVPRRVIAELGLPGAALPVISRTVAGHLRALEQGAGTGLPG